MAKKSEKKAPSKKKSSKPKVSKASVAKLLHEKGLPVLEDDTIKDMEARLSWRSNRGWLIRIIRMNPFLESLGMKRLPRKNHLYRLPDGELSDAVMKTKKVVCVRRCGLEAVAAETVVITEAPSNGGH